MVYFKWLYMKEQVDTDRRSFLSEKLEPHLHEGDSVFDLFCGYSPLCVMLLSKGYRVVGVDGCNEAITWLKKNHPTGEWSHQVFGQTMTHSLYGCNVLLLLGVGEPQHTPVFQRFLSNVLQKNDVRLIITETVKPSVKKPWYEGFKRNKKTIESFNYVEVETGLYTMKIPVTQFRDYSIYLRNAV